MELPELIPFLRKLGIKKFKDKDLELEFFSDRAPPLPEGLAADSAQAFSQADAPKPMTAEEVKAAVAEAEKGLPSALKSDAMNEDTILNWSASPELGKGEAIQGTGDAPIEPLSGTEP